MTGTYSADKKQQTQLTFLSTYYTQSMSFIYYLLLATLGLRCCVQAFSSCSKQEPLFLVACGLLIVVASHVAEHGLQSVQASVVVVHGLSFSVWPVGSSRTRDQTRVPCVGRQILNHWITREVLTELSISEHLQYSSSIKVTLTAHLKLRDQKRCCP